MGLISLNVAKVLAELRAERALLDEVILSLEKLSGGPRRPGRPRGSRSKVANFSEPEGEYATSESQGRACAGLPA